MALTAARRKQSSAKRKASALKGRRQAQPAKQPDSDDIERAVYDGMQDLRVKQPGLK